ncbi:MAG: hypothetical protein MZV63_43555 [Marinilabiliales bacterium]|nr:hypothetical protein [Marinilabiliales bacterium]
MARTPKAEVYAAIIADLKDVMTMLPGTNIAGLDARRCGNKYVAEALLAKGLFVYGRLCECGNSCNQCHQQRKLQYRDRPDRGHHEEKF